MNSLARNYAFNQNLDRFDVHVLNAYKDEEAVRWTRDRLIEEVQEGQLDHLLLKRVEGLQNLATATNEKAAINVIDFLIEPLVLRTMSAPQLEGYFRRIQRVMHLEEITGLGEGRPLWIDAVHHTCSFAVIYEFCSYLIRHRGYQRLVLLHDGQGAEAHLELIAFLLWQVHNIQLNSIMRTGDWFSSLAQLAGPDLAILYFADVPQETSEWNAPRERMTYTIQLDPAPNFPVRLETVSGSPVFAGRLNASHVVLDYPTGGRVHVRPFDAAEPVVRCPLEDWVFWPLLKAA